MGIGDTNITASGRLINALFDTKDHARKAQDDLVAAGIPSQHITLTEGRDGSGEISGASTSATTATSTSVAPGEHKGFWESLKDFFLPDEDRHAYAEGLGRGGYLLSVRSDEANYNRVADILDRDGAVDLDEREGQWRAQGWTGYPAGTLAEASVGNQALASDLTVGGGIGLPSGGEAQASRDAAVGINSSSLGVGSVGAAGNAPVAARDTELGRSRIRGYVSGTRETSALTGTFSPSDASLITEHMDVISADGKKIGEVDHLDGPDRIKLSRNASPDGQHHYVPFSWIDHVDQHVHLTKTLEEINVVR